MRWLVLLLAILIGCAAPAAHPATGTQPTQPAQPAQPAQEPPPAASWRAVLIAGDGEIQAFDNATERMASLLSRNGRIAPSQIARLSGRQAVVSSGKAGPATLYRIAQAITAMQPPPGDACLVFITSHGVPHDGVALTWNQELLGPVMLDRLLTAGCGDAPTVVIVSACFSGNFAAAPMARANRIVLTAARHDRPSFGCGAGDVYTYFDECLLNTLRSGARWSDTLLPLQTCVAQREAGGGDTPSHPQSFIGLRAAGLTVP